ncbi:MAG: zinc ribbon domain-containing protein [Candidatus Sulfotelmatobacter sp.]
MPTLVILSEDLWNEVQNRFRVVDGAHQITSGKGLLSRALTSPYLFSNLLKCGLCGSNLIIASGGGKKPK